MINLATNNLQINYGDDAENVAIISDMEVQNCRLCHNIISDDEKNVNIYAHCAAPTLLAVESDNARQPAEQEEELDKPPLVHILRDLFQVTYERHQLLSNLICGNCLKMVFAFYKFRECLRNCEKELQLRLEQEKQKYSRYRPGLNGNPGIFEPEFACEIIEVNPEANTDSSDDEFSVATDSQLDENEDTTMENAADHRAFQRHNNLNRNTAIQQQQLIQQQQMQHQLQQQSQSQLQHQSQTQLQPHPQYQSQHLQALQPESRNLKDSKSISMNASLSDCFRKETFLCQYCDTAFITQAECTDHELHNHDAAMPYRCAFCPLSLATRPALIYHIRESHNGDRPYACMQCRKGFCRRSDLKKHTIVHTGIRPYSCNVCTKSFSRNTNLTKHLRIHTGGKPFICQVCPRSFNNAVDLMKHTRGHMENKAFACCYCASSFARRDKLNLHMSSHHRLDVNNDANAMPGTFNASAEQNHYGKSILATQLQQQSQPQATSTPISMQAATSSPIPLSVTPATSKQRNLTCKICEKTFQRERDYQRHQALHLDTLFTCKLCGLIFNRPEKLARHELEQHVQQYPCNICNASFYKQDELHHHMKMHELQQNIAMHTQAAVSALHSQTDLNKTPNEAIEQQLKQQLMNSKMQQRSIAADYSFYSNMVPTMSLGFYSETQSEERNGNA